MCVRRFILPLLLSFIITNHSTRFHIYSFILFVFFSTLIFYAFASTSDERNKKTMSHQLINYTLTKQWNNNIYLFLHRVEESRRGMKRRIATRWELRKKKSTTNGRVTSRQCQVSTRRKKIRFCNLVCVACAGKFTYCIALEMLFCTIKVNGNAVSKNILVRLCILSI